MKFCTPFTLILLVTAMIAASAVSRSAHAFSFYTDVSGGLTRAQSASSFLSKDTTIQAGGGTPSSTNSGYSANIGVFFRPASTDAIVELQFGVLYRIQMLGADITGNSSGPTSVSYTLNTPYPVVRLQVTRLYLGVGYSPFMMRNIGSSLDYLNIRRSPSTANIYLEGGLLWPITPKFSLAASLAMTQVRQGGTASPSPIFDALFCMRFYWGFSKGGGSGGGGGGDSNEFKGWRYPFGQAR